MLIGNKLDLPDERQVTAEVAEAFAKRHEMQYFEVSAKTGANVADSMREFLGDIQTRIDEGGYGLTHCDTTEVTKFENEDDPETLIQRIRRRCC
jgi:GTPase SAR1 family protein